MTSSLFVLCFSGGVSRHHHLVFIQLSLILLCGDESQGDAAHQLQAIYRLSAGVLAHRYFSFMSQLDICGLT